MYCSFAIIGHADMMWSRQIVDIICIIIIIIIIIIIMEFQNVNTLSLNASTHLHALQLLVQCLLLPLPREPKL